MNRTIRIVCKYLVCWVLCFKKKRWFLHIVKYFTIYVLWCLLNCYSRTYFEVNFQWLVSFRIVRERTLLQRIQNSLFYSYTVTCHNVRYGGLAAWLQPSSVRPYVLVDVKLIQTNNHRRAETRTNRWRTNERDRNMYSDSKLLGGSWQFVIVRYWIPCSQMNIIIVS